MTSIRTCPHCGDAIHENASACPHCGAETSSARSASPQPDMVLVTVFTTADVGLIAIAKSLLEAEEIDYMTRGERLKDLFAVTDPVKFLVRSEDAARTRALLHDLSATGELHSTDEAG